MSWELASSLITDGTIASLSKLGRVPSDTRKYRKFRSENILATYASVTDYLYASVFDIECEMKGKLRKIPQICGGDLKERLIVLIWNIFHIKMQMES
jgi:hypothetical protein